MYAPPEDILVVDDEPEIRSMMGDFLRDGGRRCVTAETGRKAFDLLCQRPFDLVISDIAMPEMTGMELLEKVRVVRPGCPVILITGFGTTEWAKQAIRYGAFDYIEKPFDFDTLSGTVERALRHAKNPDDPVGSLTEGETVIADPFSRDPLTGLFNHRRFIEELGRLRSACRRTNQPVCVIFVDIDHFRSINEEHGNKVGDAVLSKLGGRLQPICRSIDPLARYAWDQFAIAMPDTQLADALCLAERCLETVREKAFVWEGRSIPWSVSIGVAECESGFIENERQLLRRVAEALAEAKRRGGDVAVHWREIQGIEVNSVGPDTSRLAAMRGEFERVQEQLRQTCLESTRALVAAVEAKDPYTEQHSMTVAHYAAALGRELGLSPKQLEVLRTAAILHDVGKIGIPDSVLTKPSSLTDHELELIKQHTIMGVQILEHTSFLRSELPIILHHHERWDGNGYPAGLADESIPLLARILHVADSLDAMLSKRSYKHGYALDKVIGELRRGAGRQFDPRVAERAIRWLESNPDQIVWPDQREKMLASTAG